MEGVASHTPVCFVTHSPPSCFSREATVEGRSDLRKVWCRRPRTYHGDVEAAVSQAIALLARQIATLSGPGRSIATRTQADPFAVNPLF